MFKKLAVVTTLFTVCMGSSFAHHTRVGSDASAPVFKDATPCPSHTFLAGPYIGLSVGSKVNYAGTPVVYTGIEGTVSLGYAYPMAPSTYIGGEIFGGDSAQVKNYVDTLNQGVKTTWTYGASLLPGYFINENLLAYVRLSALRSRYKDISTTRNAWQVGVGGETSLDPNWDLRAEFLYSAYNKSSVIGKPQTNAVNVGVVYKFI